MVNSTEFRTSNTALATYLICAGFTLSEIDYSDVHYVYIFPNNDGINEHAQKFEAGLALVDPAKYQRVNRKLARLFKNQKQWWEG